MFCACVWQALAYPGFKDVLPNGNEVPHPCKANYLWHGVGHHNPLGGGTRNQFGLDFSAAGRVCRTSVRPNFGSLIRYEFY